MKREGQKMRILELKDILERETDDQHGITMARILELLSMRGIKAERKSIYDVLRALEEAEVLEIVGPQGKNREYAVAARDFELPELKMIIDSVQASKFLSEAKSRELIKKLGKLCSRHEEQTLQRSVVLANRVKNVNKSIFIAVDTIHRAIAANKQIQFKYYDYTIHKERKYFRKGAFYIASPFALIYSDDNYYLLAYESGKFKHFRVDKMESVKLLELIDREGREEFEKVDMAAYSKYTFNMYGGKIEHVTMVFQNRFVGTVLDRFGRDVVIMKEDDEHFRITVSVAVSYQFFGWLFGLGKGARIIGPESVKEKMKKALADAEKMYG